MVLLAPPFQADCNDGGPATQRFGLVGRTSVAG